MPRRLTKGVNNNIRWQEFVYDVDEDNVDHPQSNIVQLWKKDGSKVPNAQRTPTWLQCTVNELGVSQAQGRWEELLEITIVNPDVNLTSGTYTFKFLADDGIEQTPRFVTLTVR